jgi:hypothetical protein
MGLPPKNRDSLQSKKYSQLLFHPHMAKELSVTLTYIGILPIFRS